MQKFIIVLLFLIFGSSHVFSSETDYFVSLKKDKVNVRYGPGLDYPIKYIYKKKFLPVKVIDKKENFRKIIDHKKNSGWVHRIMLQKSKSLIATSEKILFKKPTKYSEPLAKLEKGRLLIFKKCVKDWCNIKSDQYSGWISKNNLWGISK